MGAPRLLDRLVVVGASHRSASLALLEQLAIGAERRPAVLRTLMGAGCRQVAILSTCSRTEIYAVTGHPGGGAPLEALLAGTRRDERELGDAIVRLEGREAAAHLFAVTTGLDSRVAGEVEIQGQVRAAIREAERHGTAGPLLREVFAAAVATARRAHRETGLADLGRSMGRSGVEAGLDGLDADGLAVALLGTGRMATVAAERLREAGSTPVVYARSAQGGERWAAAGHAVRGLEQLDLALDEADVVICATSARTPMLTTAHVEAAMRRRPQRPLTLIDLGAPRNVDPGCVAVGGVRLVDLEGIGDDRRPTDRAGLDQALQQAASIVAAGVRSLGASGRRRDLGPILARLHRDAEAACRGRLREWRPELVADGTLDRVARSTSRRLVHTSIGEVLDALDSDDDQRIARIARAITTDGAEAVCSPAAAPPLLPSR